MAKSINTEYAHLIEMAHQNLRGYKIVASHWTCFFKKSYLWPKKIPTLSHSIHYGPKAVNVDINSLCPRGPQEIAEYGTKDQFTVGLIVSKL